MIDLDAIGYEDVQTAMAYGRQLRSAAVVSFLAAAWRFFVRTVHNASFVNTVHLRSAAPALGGISDPPLAASR